MNDKLAELEALVQVEKVRILGMLLRGDEIELMIRAMLEEVIGAHVALALGMKESPWARGDKWEHKWERNKSVEWSQTDRISVLVKETTEKLASQLSETTLSDASMARLVSAAQQAYRYELEKELVKAVESKAREAAKKLIEKMS